MATSDTSDTAAIADYVVPTKQIVSPSDLHAFLHSDTYTLVHAFIEDLSSCVEDTPITPDIPTSTVSPIPECLIKLDCEHFIGDSSEYR
jgi:hypothetical protein